MTADEVSAAVDRLGDCYTQFCQQLGAFCSFLGMSADYSTQARQDRMLLEALFQTVAAPET